MPIKMKINKAYAIPEKPGLVMTDGYIRPGAIKINDDDTISYSVHIYRNPEDFDNGVLPESVVNGTIGNPSLVNQIKADIVSRPEFDVATDE